MQVKLTEIYFTSLVIILLKSNFLAEYSSVENEMSLEMLSNENTIRFFLCVVMYNTHDFIRKLHWEEIPFI